ncbi:UNVERIFIED_CONTAM: hypothetical protein FKN15_006905 [Acipenser sinensis]
MGNLTYAGTAWYCLPIESITGAEALVESCGDGEPQKKKRATEQSISSSRGETLGSPVMLPTRSATSVVGGNRKVTILGGAHSCKYSGRFHCSQLRGSPLLEKPWQRVDCRKEFAGYKGEAATSVPAFALRE